MRGAVLPIGLAGILALAWPLTAGTSVSVHKRLPPKEYPCDIRAFKSDEEAEARGKFDRVCSIVTEVDTSVNGRAEAKAYTEVQRAACGCGADAVIVRYIGGGGPNVSISAEAIAFEESPK